MRPLRTVLAFGSALGITLCAAPAASAVPLAGCNPAYQLRTVVSLQAEASDASDAFLAATDENGDGFLCNKYLPEPAAAKGLVFDNTKKVR